MPTAQTLVVFTGYVLGGVALAWGLPQQVPPSWTASAGRTFWLGRPLMAFSLPTALVVTDFLLRDLCVKHPIDEAEAPNALAVYDAIFYEDALANASSAGGSTTTKTSAAERVLHLHQELVGLEAPADILDVTHVVVVDHKEIGGRRKSPAEPRIRTD